MVDSTSVLFVNYKSISMKVKMMSAEDSFRPKPSKIISRSMRTINKPLTPDEDTWVELKCLVKNKHRVEKKKKKKHRHSNVSSTITTIRSIFFSLQRGLMFWDEPPTGASNIILRQRNKKCFDAVKEV